MALQARWKRERAVRSREVPPKAHSLHGSSPSPGPAQRALQTLRPQTLKRNPSKRSKVLFAWKASNFARLNSKARWQVQVQHIDMGATALQRDSVPKGSICTSQSARPSMPHGLLLLGMRPHRLQRPHQRYPIALLLDCPMRPMQTTTVTRHFGWVAGVKFF